jgi:hypothetical protein
VLTTVRHNRALKLLKTRDGAGKGLVLAYDFGKAGPSFTELGLVTAKGEEGEEGA